MKKNIFFILVGFLAIISYIILDNIIVKEAKVHGIRSFPQTFEQLIERSEYIVEVKKTGKSTNILVNEGLPTESGYTETPVEIQKVYKGNWDKKEILKVHEAIYTAPIKGVQPGKIIFTSDDYTALKPNSKYLLFLRKHKGTDGYWITADEFSKFNLDDTDSEEKKFGNKDSMYKKFKTSFIKKYLK